jgi:hypothetical protein
MSKFLVTQYQNEVEKIIQYGGSKKETSIRFAFQNLLNEYCKPKDFLLIAELDYKTKSGKTIGSIHFRQIDNLWEDRIVRKR